MSEQPIPVIRASPVEPTVLPSTPAGNGRIRKPPLAPPARRPPARNWRKSLFRLHGWLGLNVGLLLFVICFSGSWATVSNELDWLANPDMRTPTQDAPYAWAEMLRTIDARFPDAHNLGIYAPEGPGFAALSLIRYADGQMRKAYLNPYTGELQGHTSFFNTQRFFRSFHRQFFDGRRGTIFVTFWGIALLVAALTGFIFYKGWLKQLVTLRWTKGLRLLWSDLHKTTGIWSLVFTLLIALTGIFYFIEAIYQTAGQGAALVGPPLPDVSEASYTEAGPLPTLPTYETYIANAQAAYPGWEIRQVRPSLHPSQPVRIFGQAGNVLTRDRADRVHVDPLTGEVLGIQRTADLAVIPFISDAVDPLHFGYFGGFWTKLLWVAFGLVLSFSILAGTYLWVVRSLNKRARSQSHWMRGATVALLLTLIYFGFATYSTFIGIIAYRTAPTPIPIIETTLGPYTVRVACEYPCQNTSGHTYHLHFLNSSLPNYHSAALMTGETTTLFAGGRARITQATLSLDSPRPTTLALTLHDGTIYTAALPTRPVTLPNKEKMTWPDTAPGVWWIVTLFLALTLVSVIGWLYLIWRVWHKNDACRRDVL